jgi:hypothetical protein
MPSDALVMANNFTVEVAFTFAANSVITATDISGGVNTANFETILAQKIAKNGNFGLSVHWSEITFTMQARRRLEEVESSELKQTEPVSRVSRKLTSHDFDLSIHFVYRQYRNDDDVIDGTDGANSFANIYDLCTEYFDTNKAVFIDDFEDLLIETYPSTFTANKFIDAAATVIVIPTTFTQVLLHSAFPTGFPTSMPSCGVGVYDINGNLLNVDGCEQCRAGYYNDRFNVQRCTACPMDYYSASQGAIECTACTRPFATASAKHGGYASCTAIQIGLSVGVTSALVLCLLGLFIGALYFAEDLKVVAFVIMMFPTLDILSDLAYILSNRYASIPLFVCGIVFFFTPNIIFFHKLNEIGAYPSFCLQYFYKEESWDGINKLQNKKGIYDKVFWIQHETWVNRIVMFPLQCITAIPAVVLICITFPFYFVWSIIGLYIFQCKVLSIGRVWTMWMYVWTGHNGFRKEVKVDTGILNESLFAEFLSETLPQLVIQGVNNKLIGMWTPMAIFSACLSITIAVNGVYRYGYYTIWLGMNIDDVPTKISIAGVINVTLKNDKQIVGASLVNHKATALKIAVNTAGRLISYVYNDKVDQLNASFDEIFGLLEGIESDKVLLQRKEDFKNQFTNMMLDKTKILEEPGGYNPEDSTWTYTSDECSKDLWSTIVSCTKDLTMFEKLESVGFNSHRDFLEITDDIKSKVLSILPSDMPKVVEKCRVLMALLDANEQQEEVQFAAPSEKRKSMISVEGAASLKHLRPDDTLGDVGQLGGPLAKILSFFGGSKPKPVEEAPKESSSSKEGTFYMIITLLPRLTYSLRHKLSSTRCNRRCCGSQV